MDVVNHITSLGYTLLRYYGVKTNSNTIMLYYQPDTERFIRIIDMVCRIETGSYRPLCNTRLNIQQLNKMIDKLDSEKHSSIECIEYPKGVDMKYNIIKPHDYTYTGASITPEDIFAYGIISCPQDVYVPLAWELEDKQYRNGFKYGFRFTEQYKRPIWFYDRKMDISNDDRKIALDYLHFDKNVYEWYDAKTFLDSPCGYEGERNMYFVLHKNSGCSKDTCENLLDLAHGYKYYYSGPPRFHTIFMRRNIVRLYIIADDVPSAYDTTINKNSFKICQVISNKYIHI